MLENDNGIKVSILVLRSLAQLLGKLIKINRLRCCCVHSRRQHHRSELCLWKSICIFAAVGFSHLPVVLPSFAVQYCTYAYSWRTLWIRRSNHHKKNNCFLENLLLFLQLEVSYF